MEIMGCFFTERVEGYDDHHMLTKVEGCKEGYIKKSKLVPASCNSHLDLGCGIRLELDEIIERMLGVKNDGL